MTCKHVAQLSRRFFEQFDGDHDYALRQRDQVEEAQLIYEVQNRLLALVLNSYIRDGAGVGNRKHNRAKNSVENVDFRVGARGDEEIATVDDQKLN